MLQKGSNVDYLWSRKLAFQQAVEDNSRMMSLRKHSYGVKERKCMKKNMYNNLKSRIANMYKSISKSNSKLTNYPGILY